MPTYDYECLACKHTFELFQKMTDEPIKKCPLCKKNRVKRLIGPGTGIIFKGAGFYETDYKRKIEKREKPEAVKKGDAKIKPEPDMQAKSEQSAGSTQVKKIESVAKDSGKEKDKK